MEERRGRGGGSGATKQAVCSLMQADHVWNSLMEDDLKSLEAGKKKEDVKQESAKREENGCGLTLEKTLALQECK